MVYKPGENNCSWDEALLQATYLRKRNVTPVLDMENSQEMSFENATDTSEIKIFGCTAHTN